jgi:hypothetical protein
MVFRKAHPTLEMDQASFTTDGSQIYPSKLFLEWRKNISKTPSGVFSQEYNGDERTELDGLNHVDFIMRDMAELCHESHEESLEVGDVGKQPIACSPRPGRGSLR